jgi:hypothetical protein
MDKLAVDNKHSIQYSQHATPPSFWANVTILMLFSVALNISAFWRIGGSDWLIAPTRPPRRFQWGCFVTLNRLGGSDEVLWWHQTVLEVPIKLFGDIGPSWDTRRKTITSESLLSNQKERRVSNYCLIYTERHFLNHFTMKAGKQRNLECLEKVY